MFTVETPVDAKLIGQNGYLTFILKDPDFTTAQRIADAVNYSENLKIATVESAGATVACTEDAAGAGLRYYVHHRSS